MATATFAAALKAVLAHEGGYVNDPHDPGGETNKGVTKRVYDSYRKARGEALRSVRHITDEEIGWIYRLQYWNAIRADDLPVGLDYALFDYAVNSGPAKAAKDLQRALGVRVDGQIGAVTLAAAQAMGAAKAIDQLCNTRLTFLESLSGWRRYGRGWSKRVESVRRRAKAMTASPYATPPLGLLADPTPKADPATISPARTAQGKASLVTTAGAVATGATAAASQIEPFADMLDVVKWIVIGLTIVGAVAGIVVAINSAREGKEA